MTDETLAEILSGRHDPTGRAVLHAMLDELLDAADADGDGGKLDAPAFWAFVSLLARGRGIADEIVAAAARHIVAAGGLPAGGFESPAGVWPAVRMTQWAYLSALLRRVAAFSGEIIPRQLLTPLFFAVADNIVAGRGDTGRGPHMDLLGLGTQKGAEWKAEARAAKWLLVSAVHYRAAKTGQSMAKVLRATLPDLPESTWKDWKDEVAEAKRVSVKDVGNEARSAAITEDEPSPCDLSAEDMQELATIAARGMKSLWGGKRS